MSHLSDFIFGFVYEMLDTETYTTGDDIDIPYLELGYTYDSFDEISQRIISGECALCCRYIDEHNCYNGRDFVDLGQRFYRVRSRIEMPTCVYGDLFELFLPISVINDGNELNVCSFANIPAIQKHTKHLRLLNVLELRLNQMMTTLPTLAEQYLLELDQSHSKLMYMCTGQDKRKFVRLHEVPVNKFLDFLCGYTGIRFGYKLVNQENEFYLRTINQLIDYIKCLKPELINLPLKNNNDLKNYVSYIISNGETYVKSI